MARISKRLTDIHAEALAEFDLIQSAVRDERIQALEDRRFYSISGAQWEGPLGAQFENKPRMEFNKVHLAVIRIINEYRNNRITVDFVSKEGDEYDSLAEMCDDLYRADEQDSSAEEAYDNAFEEAVGGGFGAYRFKTEYEDEEDEENEKQRIRICPIYDADSSVFFDINAKRQDKADAKTCYVLTAMARETYKSEYDDDPASWPKEINHVEFDWSTPDVVYIVEYYRVEEIKETVHVYEMMDGEEERYTDSDFENDESLRDMLQVQGAKKVREKKVKRRKVHKYIMSGGKVLEDCGYIAGKHIPIVPQYGKRWFVDNVERFMGHVRLAKDSQRLGNMQRSKLAEMSALSSIQKPIFTPEQVAGHQLMWSEDNIKQYPYMLVNPITDANGQPAVSGPIGYTKPPDIPPAMGALLQITDQDMREILGNQEQADKIVSNISGQAIDLIQQRLDMQTFIYMSNAAVARRRGGEIWLSMAKEVYVEEGRKMKGIGTQNTIKQIELMRPVVDEDGEVEYENDLSEAAFDIASEVGPSSNSKRNAATRTLISLLQLTQDPQDRAILSSMILMNTDGEGMGDVREYYRRKMVMMGVVKPTDKEKEEIQAAMQNQKPDAQTQYMMAEAERASAEATDLRAGAVKKVADAELSRSKTAETLAGIDREEKQQVVDMFSTINEIQLGKQVM